MYSRLKDGFQKERNLVRMNAGMVYFCVKTTMQHLIIINSSFNSSLKWVEIFLANANPDYMYLL